MKLILFVVCSFVISIESAKCPESRKPHSTSCTVFYKCVNLPEGGYVWVPSKCTEGLIFQPYLRICVLSGDDWSCDTSSMESSILTNKYQTPELIDPNKSSYMGLTQDPVNLSELIDSSYTIDNIPDSLNQEIVTPYPLIEIEDTGENIYDKNTDNIAGTSTVQYGYLQTQNGNKKQSTKDKYSMLNRLIHHLLIYKEITIPLELLASSSLPMPPKANINTNEMPYDEPESSKINKQNVLMSYLIHNYVQQNNLQNNIVTEIKSQSTTGTSKTLKDERNESTLNTDTSSHTLQTLLDNSRYDNIVLITDSVGNKQYLTTESFRSMNYNLDSQFVQFIQCVKNIRMPNVTDCIKYYTCDPDTVSVIEYTCPLNTAFNKHTRMCNSEMYDTCMKSKREQENINVSKDSSNKFQITAPNENICKEVGKAKDPTSESRYYICYSSDKSQSIKSIRMTCPNGLIFCQSKKVCSTRRSCTK